MKRRNWPASAACSIFSIAFRIWSIFAVVGLTPIPSSVELAESYGSESIVTRPLNAGSKRSLIEFSSRPVFFGL